jgi:hypothetical protein
LDTADFNGKCKYANAPGGNIKVITGVQMICGTPLNGMLVDFKAKCQGDPTNVYEEIPGGGWLPIPLQWCYFCEATKNVDYFNLNPSDTGWPSGFVWDAMTKGKIGLTAWETQLTSAQSTAWAPITDTGGQLVGAVRALNPVPNTDSQCANFAGYVAQRNADNTYTLYSAADTANLIAKNAELDGRIQWLKNDIRTNGVQFLTAAEEWKYIQDNQLNQIVSAMAIPPAVVSGMSTMPASLEYVPAQAPYNIRFQLMLLKDLFGWVEWNIPIAQAQFTDASGNPVDSYAFGDIAASTDVKVYVKNIGDQAGGVYVGGTSNNQFLSVVGASSDIIQPDEVRPVTLKLQSTAPSDTSITGTLKAGAWETESYTDTVVFTATALKTGGETCPAGLIWDAAQGKCVEQVEPDKLELFGFPIGYWIVALALLVVVYLVFIKKKPGDPFSDINQIAG